MLEGRYRLLTRLGHGSFGEVWRGVDERVNRPCAIKQVLLGGATPQEQAERLDTFQREVQMLAALKHEYICDIRDWFEDQGAGYLVLELIDGRTLAVEMAARGSPGLPEAEVLGWALQLADALGYLHAQAPPIIFRDIKPENVILRPDGRLALIDFGIARPAIIAGGTLIGTPGYAPVEQYKGAAEPRSDQYALAATLHYLLTGDDPTKRSTFLFPPVCSLVPSITLHVSAAIERALSVQIDDRFDSVAEFTAALLSPLGPRSSGASRTAARMQAATKSPQAPLVDLDEVDRLLQRAQQLGGTLPHMLLIGPPPPGLLLSHIAAAVAISTGAPFRAVAANTLRKAGDLISILTNLNDGAVFYLDDMQSFDTGVRAMLRQALVENAVDFTIGKGASARVMRLGLKRFILVGGSSSRRARTIEAASLFALHVNAASIPQAWQARIAAARQPTPTTPSRPVLPAS
ncbi:MAG TPA: protein kinase, partial [Chloroflexota bacterium]|nr:protein kinase [Chloroflexota bacterium]